MVHSYTTGYVQAVNMCVYKVTLWRPDKCSKKALSQFKVGFFPSIYIIPVFA